MPVRLIEILSEDTINYFKRQVNTSMGPGWEKDLSEQPVAWTRRIELDISGEDGKPAYTDVRPPSQERSSEHGKTLSARSATACSQAFMSNSPPEPP